MRPQTILNLVLKFEVDRACFYWKEVCAWQSGQ